MLGTPPAFILSQDQTLIKSVCLRQNELTLIFAHSVINRLKLIIFTVYLGYTDITTCMRSFEFSRLSHYLIIKVLFAFLPFSNSALLLYHIVWLLSTPFFILFSKRSGERGIRTLAPLARPTPLAGAPLRPLEYFSKNRTMRL